MPAVIADTVASTVANALNAALKAQGEAYGDTRTSSTICTDHLDAAVESLKAAQQWLRELRADEARDARTKLKPEPKAKPEPSECECCGETIAPGDISICGGCDKPICPGCMGDNEVCKSCEEEECEP